MGFVRMSDLVFAGLAGLPEPSPSAKASLSTTARSLAAASRALPIQGLGPVLSQAQAILSQVTLMPTWDENQSWNCGFPLADPCWDNKTTVRQNLQIAADTARSRIAQASGQTAANAPLANQAPVQSVNLARETVANLPAAVQERAVEIAQGRIDMPEQRAVLGLPPAAQPPPPVAPRQASAPALAPVPVQQPRVSQPVSQPVSLPATAPRPVQPVAVPAPASPADIQFNFTSTPVSSAPQVTLPDFNAVGTALQTSAAASARRIAEAAALSAERAARGPVQLTAAPITRQKEQGLSPTAILLIAGGGVVLVGGAILLLSMGRSAPAPVPQPWGQPPPGWGPPPGWVPQAMSPPVPVTANRGRRRGRSRT